MGISFPLFFFLCDFLGASGFFCGTGLGGGQGDACMCCHARYAAWKRTVHTSRHDLHRSHTSNEETKKIKIIIIRFYTSTTYYIATEIPCTSPNHYVKNAIYALLRL